MGSARRRMMMKAAKGGLVFYDYIKGDGVAYIDIDMFSSPEPPVNTRTLTIVARPLTGNGYVVGVQFYHSGTKYGAYSSGLYRQSTMTYVRYFGYSSYYTLGTYSATAKFKLVYIGGTNKIYGYINDVQKAERSVTKVLPPLVISVFDYPNYEVTTGAFSHTTANRDNGYLWSIKTEDNVTGDVLMELKPCTYYGEVGLWETVTGTFYGNSNTTGTLTVGNDS